MDPVVGNEDMAADDATGILTFVDGKAMIPFKPLSAGSYYFILKNELNGAEIYYNSALEYGMIVVEGRSQNVNPQPEPEPVTPDDGGNDDGGEVVQPTNPDEENTLDGGDEGDQTGE